MAIVRELLIKVGFLTDKQAVTQVNKSITGFKTRFAIAASAAAYAFGKVTSYLGDIATATLDADSTARSLGMSLKELAAIQQAAIPFRLNEKQVQASLSRINKLLQDFRSGASNELALIAQGLGFEVDRVNDTTGTLFLKILQGLQKVSNEQDRIRIAGNVISEDAAVGIADIAKSVDEFSKSIEGFKEVGQEIQDTLPQMKAYEQAINNLSISWGKFVLSLSRTVFPVLQKLIEYLTILSDLAKNIFDFNGQGIVKNVNSASSLLDPLFQKTGLSNISEFFKGLYGGDTLLNKLTGNSGSSNAMVSPVITNNIDVKVEPGTTEQQANEMGQSISQAISESIYKTWQEIQYNNPVVE